MLDGSPHRRSRAGLWFAAGTVVSLLLLLASRTPQALTLQQATAHALDPIRGAISGVGSGIAGFFTTIVLLIVGVLNLAGWAYMNRSIEPRPWGEVISGFDYTPFRGDQDPRANKFASEAEIEQGRKPELLAHADRQHAAMDEHDRPARRRRLERRGDAWIVEAVAMHGREQADPPQSPLAERA